MWLVARLVVNVGIGRRTVITDHFIYYLNYINIIIILLLNKG